MIYGIGTDIIEVARIQKAIEHSEAFLTRVFSAGEIHYCTTFVNKYERLASRFAAKEAFLKAMGTGLRGGYNLNEIEVINDEIGKPSINLLGSSLEEYNKVGAPKLDISISHTHDHSVAFVVAVRR